MSERVLVKRVYTCKMVEILPTLFLASCACDKMVDPGEFAVDVAIVQVYCLLVVVLPVFINLKVIHHLIILITVSSFILTVLSH